MSSLFINDCMAALRQGYTENYNALTEQFRSLDTEELYGRVLEQMESKARRYKTERAVDGIMFTNLLTKGCPKWLEHGQVTGCSFCNYFHDIMPQITLMSVLKEKSEHHYQEAVIQSFHMLRVSNKKSTVIEGITGFDNFNTNEVPSTLPERIAAIIKENDHIRPFQYVFETRASSVTADKLAHWKKWFGRRAMIELGIETGDDWLRNHWLNKGITTAQVENAIALIHQASWKTSGNLLLGIPGLSVQEALSSFLESVHWLKGLEADHIVFSPITRKTGTLQDVLYRFRDNPHLERLGIVYGEQTGNLPITAFMETIIRLHGEGLQFFKDIYVSPISWYNYTTSILQSESNPERKAFLIKAVKMLNHYLFVAKDLSVIEEFCSLHRHTDEYRHYARLGQAPAGSSRQEQLHAAAGEMAKELWPDGWRLRLGQFESELALY